MSTYTSKFDGIEIDQLLQKTKEQQTVPDWAMAPEKPTYTFDEITGKPQTYPPADHNHDTTYLKLAGGTMTGALAADGGLTEKLPIVREADMNTFIHTGKWYLINPPTNSPIAKSGYLEVMAYEKETGFVFQRFTTYDGNKFERICVSGVWEQWCGTFMKGIWTYTTSTNGLFEGFGKRVLSNKSSYGTSIIRGSYIYVHNEPLPITLYSAGVYLELAQVDSGETHIATGGLNDTKSQVGVHWVARNSSGTRVEINMHVKGYWKKPTIPLAT